MTRTIDIEQLQTTRSEKLLALVLAVFLLIGGIWAYQEIDDGVRSALAGGKATTAERQAIEAHELAQIRLYPADSLVAQRREELELRREAYRTALDAGEPAGALKVRYRAAERALVQARADLATAKRAEAAARPAAATASARIGREAGATRERQDLVIFGLRVGAALVFLLAAFFLLTRLRDRGSRWFPLSGSAVLFATVYAFVVAVDYLTDYFDPYDSGILLLALIGAGATLVAFLLLQRYLARRLPLRRVRKRQCAYCGFPAGDNERCEGCGREAHAPCTHCAAPRRVGAPFCGACGRA